MAPHDERSQNDQYTNVQRVLDISLRMPAPIQHIGEPIGSFRN